MKQLAWIFGCVVPTTVWICLAMMVLSAWGVAGAQIEQDRLWVDHC